MQLIRLISVLRPLFVHACTLVLTLLLPGPLFSAQDYDPQPAFADIDIERGEWIDPTRENRVVPYKLFLPAGSTGALPVVVWSHGAGGSREGASYLGEHLAHHGFAVFHVQHPGTDISQVGNDGVAGLLQRVQDPQVTVMRFGDLPFVTRSIAALNASGRLTGRFDLERMGISGHSFGAISTLVAAGQQNAALGQRFAVPEFRAAFAMSPQGRRETATDMFRDMMMPVFHLTGTNDQSPANDFAPADRQIPFQVINDVDQYLLVMNDATHMTFSGRQDPNDPALELHHRQILTAAVSFWNAYLKDDAEALAWLQGAGFRDFIGDSGTYDFKPARP